MCAVSRQLAPRMRTVLWARFGGSQIPHLICRGEVVFGVDGTSSRVLSRRGREWGFDKLLKKEEDCSRVGLFVVVDEWKRSGGGCLRSPQLLLQQRARTVVKMVLSTEDVYKNTVLPSIAPFNEDGGLSGGILAGDGGRGGLHRHYTKLVNGKSAEVLGQGEKMEGDLLNAALDAQSQQGTSGPQDASPQEESNIKKEMKRFQSEMPLSGDIRFSNRKPLSAAERRRRRTFSDPYALAQGNARRQGSLREFRNDVHHAAIETWLITRLAVQLLRLLGVGTAWISKFVRLGLYALFLMPGFIQVGFFYFFSNCVHRSIVYGDQPRNRLDLYLPPESDKPRPAVIFVTGGAWIIGYKAWGSLLAQQLLDRDIIVACIDYRNFPQGSISDMVSDVSTGIGYVCNNIESFGGDPSMIFLAGQSAGAHLAACSLLMQAKREATEDPAKLSWKASQINAYMAISGGYNLIKLVEHFNKRGLYKSLFLSVMEGEDSLPVYSPEYMVMSPSFKSAVHLLPPITLFHGTADYSIPHEASVAFAVALRLMGARANTILYPDKTHTDLFLQDPMRGGRDELLADILTIIHAEDEEARAEDAVAMKRRRLVPEILLQLARRVSPF